VVNDRRISIVNDVVAEIVRIAPCKRLHKELEKETHIHQKLLRLFKHQALAASGKLS
jgi:hypothetical protein